MPNLGPNGEELAKNEGYITLEFLIIPALEQPSTQNLEQLAVYQIATSQLPPKATSSFEFTFTKPAAQGQLEFASLRQDRRKGMRPSPGRLSRGELGTLGS